MNGTFEILTGTPEEVKTELNSSVKTYFVKVLTSTSATGGKIVVTTYLKPRK